MLGGLLAATSLNQVNAQTFPISTGSGSGNLLMSTVTGGANPHAGELGRFITFDVQNDNPCPVAVTDVNMLHIGEQQFPRPSPQQPYFVSANDSSYNLYYSLTNLNGGPTPIDKANGWEFVRNSGPINTGQSNIITSIFDSISIVIPANSRARFVVHCTDTMVYYFNSTPVTTTVNGVTLISGTTNIYGGFFPGGATAASYFNVNAVTPPQTSLNFLGSVTVKQLAPNPPSADVSLKPINKCIGQDVTLKATHPKTANFGGTFTWRNSAGAILAQNTTGTHTLTNLQLSDGGKYFVTYRLCGQESAPDSIVIIMNDPPPPTVAGKFDYCLNEQFEPVTVNGTDPKWYYTPTGGSPVPVTPTINTSSPNTLFYYVSQTDQYGCESRTRTEVRFRAAAKPAPPIVNTPIYYCEEDQSEQLTAVGDTLRWYYFANGGVPTEIAPTPNTSKNDSFKYFVTQTIDGCESERSKIDVVVTFRPNGQILVDRDDICANDTITVGYYGSAFVGSQYNWALPTGATLLNDGFDQGPLEIVLDSAGLQELKLRVGQTGCLSELYIQDINVKPLPYARLSFDEDVCLAQPELIEALDYTPGLDTFIWNFAGGKTAHFTTDQGPYGVYWETEGKKGITLTMFHDGCYDWVIDTVMVHPKPNATITAEYDIWQTDENATPRRAISVTVPYAQGDVMCASDSLKVTVEQVEPGATYKWSPTRFFDTYSDRPVTYARVDFNSKIYVEVEDVYGCTNEDSLDVVTKSCCEVAVPNAFSPNGDGRNDLFRPVRNGRRQIRTFKVMNRYGQAVYESAELGGGRGWDGTFNGKPADIGTYFYLVSFECEGETVDQGGEVILVR